jgi:hypothetical protein
MLFYQLQYIFVNSLPLSHHSAVGDNQFKSYSISSTLDLFHCLLETDKTDLWWIIASWLILPFYMDPRQYKHTQVAD